MNKILHILLVFLFSLTIISCGTDDGGSSASTDNTSTTTTSDNTTTTTDTTAPKILFISPSDSQENVSIGSTISVLFSESIDNSSVTTNTSNTICSGTVQLSSNSFSSCIQMTSKPSASNSNTTFSLTPSNYLSQGTTYKTKITTGVRDLAGNILASTYTTSSGFTTVSDTTAPALFQVTAVTTPTNDTTPNYTFSSSEAGTITYGGSCSSSTTSASAGNNTVTFNALSEGTYSNCTITVTDSAINVSTLNVNTFIIDTTSPTCHR
jgi:hypothetical protein